LLVVLVVVSLHLSQKVTQKEIKKGNRKDRIKKVDKTRRKRIKILYTRGKKN
jgi:hypothetical protein